MGKSREERFFDKVERGEGCWLWLAKKNNKGYGMFRDGGRSTGFKLAHRISYEIAYDKIPDKVYVLHNCDNPGCVRPDHLRLGTHRDNMHDMHARGRGHWKTTPETAYAILWQRASGSSRRDISVDYGVSISAVKHIISRRTWQSLSHTHD